MTETVETLKEKIKEKIKGLNEKDKRNKEGFMQPENPAPIPPAKPLPVTHDSEKAIKIMIVTEGKKRITLYQMGETDLDGFNNLYEAIGWIECVFGEQEIELVKQEIKKKIPKARPWRWESKGMENPYEALGFLTFECRPEKLMGMALSLFRTPEEVLKLVQQRNMESLRKSKEEMKKTEK